MFPSFEELGAGTLRRTVLRWLFLVMLFACIASAQPTQCTVSVPGTVPTLRLTGLTELIADIDLTCSGGTQTPENSPIPKVTVRLDLNAPLGNKVLGSSYDAILQVRDSGITPRYCANADGCPLTGVRSGISPYNGASAARPNIFFLSSMTPGTFYLPMDPVTGGTRTYRISNVRVGAQALHYPGSKVYATINITTETYRTVTVTNGSNVLVGTLGADLKPVLYKKDGVTPAPAEGVPVSACGPAPTGPVAWLRFTEPFPSAFRRRSPAFSSSAPPAPTAQTTAFRTNETGVYLPDAFTPLSILEGNPTGGAEAGLADFGTRFFVRLSRQDGSKTVYFGSSVSTPIVNEYLARTFGNSGGVFASDRPVNLGGYLASPYDGYTMTWEVLGTQSPDLTDSFDIPVYVRITGQTALTGTVQIEAGFAPDPDYFNLAGDYFYPIKDAVPRFGTASFKANFLNFYSCPIRSGIVALGDARVGFAFSRTYSFEQGLPPYSVSLASTLPPGLRADFTTTPGSVIVSGTPTQAGSYDFSFKVNDSNEGSATITYSLDVWPPTSCTYSWNPSSLSIGPGAGSGSVQLTVTGTGCTWHAGSDASWFTAGPSGGTGTTTLTWSAAANTGSTARTASVLLSGGMPLSGPHLTITQAATSPCAVTLSAPAISASSGSTTGTINLTTTPAGCAWKASSDVSWAQIFPLSGSGAASLSYTVFPNFRRTQRNGTLTVGDKNISIAQAANTLTEDERFVDLMYFSFMGRLPSAAERDFQVTKGLRAGLTRTDLGMNFLNSTEFNSGGRFVAGLYVGLLDRDAEFGGWLFQRNALFNGQVSQIQQITNFLNAQEYALKFGSPTNDQFVTLLYQKVLLRNPTPAEVAFQSGALAGGTSRTTLAQNFLNSQEFRIGTGPRLTAFLMFATLLQRQPADSEFAVQRDAIASGTPVRNVVNAFLESAEFSASLN